VRAPPNVLLVVMDDVGPEALEEACTPVIDALAARGARFTRAYAQPSCSPSRAALLTGRWPFRTGIGDAIRTAAPGHSGSLSLAELTLLEHFRAHGYSTGWVGKWHVSLPKNHANPNEQGADFYAGCLHGMNWLGPWEWTRQGRARLVTTYGTTQLVIDAREALSILPEPWLLVLSFDAAHEPYHVPPPGTCRERPGCACREAQGERGLFLADVETIDLALEELAPSLPPGGAHPLVTCLLGDNGTDTTVSPPCPRPGKAEVYEGGVLVPLVITGPGVVPGARDELASVVDLFATLCDLAGLPTPPEAQDSVSLVPVLRRLPGQVRDWVYVERFFPLGLPLHPTLHLRAAIEPRWKLIRRTGALPAEELFDLAADPCEARDLLLGPLSPQARAARLRLEDRLDLLGVH